MKGWACWIPRSEDEKIKLNSRSARVTIERRKPVEASYFRRRERQRVRAPWHDVGGQLLAAQ